MPTFFLVEHCLRKQGGHYLNYVREVLGAAENAGYRPVLAVNREFQEIELLPANWRVLPIFKHRAQRMHRLPSVANFGPDQGGKLKRRIGEVLEAGRVALKGLRMRAQQRRFVDDFVEGCRELFDAVPLEAGDVVYFSTIGDLDALALARFLSERPETEGVSWHLQFHNLIYAGRDPSFPGQEAEVRGLKERFAAIRAQLPGHDLTYHSTVDALTRQFHLIGETSASTLPWPVGAEFHDSGSVPTDRPLRVVLAGALRQEKGSKFFRPMFQRLAEAGIGDDRIQFLLQCNEKRLREDLADLPTARADSDAVMAPEKLPDAPIVALPMGLPGAAYVNLIKIADIGLLLHAADEYFARASGVLGEYLAAAVPVIVPSGSWMSDQIQGVNDQYLGGLLECSTVLHRWSSEALPMLDAAGGEASLELDFEPSGADLLVQLDFGQDQGPGCYAKITVEQFGNDGHPLTSLSSTRAARPGEPLPSALFHLRGDAVRAKLSVRSAYDDGVLAMTRVEVARITTVDGSHRPAPMGLAGLMLDDPEFLPELMLDAITHYAHYHDGALQFAVTWRHEHAPERTIEILTGRLAPTT